MKKERCMFCGSPATLLCDGVLGYLPKVVDRQEFIDPLHPYTCDAPLCEHCAVQQSRVHICRRRRGCVTATIDYCPICVRTLPPYPHTIRRIIHSPEQAWTLRRAHWARLSGQKGLKLEQGGGQQCLEL